MGQIHLTVNAAETNLCGFNLSITGPVQINLELSENNPGKAGCA